MSHVVSGLLLLVAAPAESAQPGLSPQPPAQVDIDQSAVQLVPAAGAPIAEGAPAAPPAPASSASNPVADQTPLPGSPTETPPVTIETAPSDDAIVVSGSSEAPKEDPLEAANVQSYKAIQAVDTAIVRPVAMGYKSAVPKPIRSGIRNFINNLDEPVVALNFLLQLKPGKAAETLGRFAINSTIGIGGLIDVAKDKPFNLPRRYNGLANTLGYYGVGPGPYLFLPVIGPTTARDLVGRVVDFAIVPGVVGKPLTDPEVSIPKGVLGALGDRIAEDARITKLRDNTDDGYGEIRRNYLERRQGEIDALKGRTAPVAPVAPVAVETVPVEPAVVAPQPAPVEAQAAPAPVAP